MEVSEQTRQRWIVCALALIVAATRFLALSHSLWDWDEFLFSISLHDYNIGIHHPHPPGFPLYIGIARLFRQFIHDDFRALRAVQLLASLFVFPVTYALARALRFPFVLAVSAALLYSFLPNVWAFGGTAFSDVFSVVLLFAGLALLFASAGSRWRYFVGTALFSLSLLVRPQGVLMAFAWFVASWPRLRTRRFGEVAAAALLSIVIVGAGYGASAYATGPSLWLDAVHKHGAYVASVDGYKNPNRMPIVKLLPEFLYDPFEAGMVSRILFGFAVASLFRPKRRDLMVLATFVPTVVMSLFLLSQTGISRLSLPYIVMNVLLGVDGIALVVETATAVIRKPQFAVALEILCVAVLLGRYIQWVWPALRIVRHTDSPPVAAMRWIRGSVPRGAPLVVDGGFFPQAEWGLRDYQVSFTDDPNAKPVFAKNAWYFGQGTSDAKDAVNFTRPQPKLWALFHRRDFAATVHPLFGALQFTDGWYGEEGDGVKSWRWMGRHADIELQAIPSGGELRFVAGFPLDREPPPRVQVSLDGKPLDAFVATTDHVTRRYALGGSKTPHVITFDVSNTVNLARQHVGSDTRDLGMVVDSITWRP